MPHLALSLLGPFQAELDGKPVNSFASNKVRALLAYLAVEIERPHLREMLAGLLWPERPDRTALGNLRYALADLRRAIGDRESSAPFLLISRAAIQLNPDGDFNLDTAKFARLARTNDQASLEQAVALYRGSFLESFSAGSAAVEEWVLFKREQFRWQMLEALRTLAALYEQQDEPAQALPYVRRQLELEPWQEEAHQKMMHFLANTGQRSAALAQYEVCRRLLASELGVEPSSETTALYNAIRRGPSGRAAGGAVGGGLRPIDGTAVELPGAVTSTAGLFSPVLPFVARQAELAWLNRFLALASMGQGSPVFVAGESGSGKTALIAELGRQALDGRGNWALAGGRCSSAAGRGCEYHPFREMLQQLVVDVPLPPPGSAAPPAAGRLSAWLDAVRVLLEAGPGLVGPLVPGELLAAHLNALGPRGGDLSDRLEGLLRRSPGPGAQPGGDLFGELTRTLWALARRQPLLLIVDDLQWADPGSLDLLFHLARRLAGSRILLVGAYRPADLVPGQRGEQHPLLHIIRELQQKVGEVCLDLDQTDGRLFVDEWLDTEPNRLEASFRETLYALTGGQALFTVELVRDMQQRGDLRRDTEGRWIAAPDLVWDRLPPRVQAAIADRVDRLPQPWRTVLSAASVQGREFEAEVVALALNLGEAQVGGLLSGALSKQHRLVSALHVQRPGPDGPALARYCFQQPLVQRYLYSGLDPVERARLHADTARSLRSLYGGRLSEIADRLAWHRQQAVGDLP